MDRGHIHTYIHISYSIIVLDCMHFERLDELFIQKRDTDYFIVPYRHALFMCTVFR